MERAIIHVDMDAFFAAIEQRDNPLYVGQPVVVGGARDGRGVVSTASYEARKYGVHSAMAMHDAVQRCPDCIYLPVDMTKYRMVSEEIMTIFKQFTPLVEAISLDEAFLDVTGSKLLFGDAQAIGWAIKQRIDEQLHLKASVGIAHNKFLAKLASDWEKPDGFFVIMPEEIQSKVWPLPVSRMMGVGAKTNQQLQQWRIITIGQLAQMDGRLLEKILGKQGIVMHQLANGIDPRPVIDQRVIKSVGRETTFQNDIDDQEKLEKILMDLTDDVAHTLRMKELKGKTITLKIRYNDFKSITRAITLDHATANFQTIFDHVKRLLTRYYQDDRPIRLIGVSVSQLVHQQDLLEQMSLFNQADNYAKHNTLDGVLDQLNDKFGKKMVTRARQMSGEGDEHK